MTRKRHSRARFKKTVFGNGLTLITEQHPEFKSLAIGAWVKAGTRHERPAESGISHFIEHMLFKGTDSRSALDIAREIDRVGGDFNAFTAREYTCFHLLLLNKDLGLGLEILSDIVLNSRFDSEELERERKVVLQEIAMVEESPEELVHDLFFEMIYGRHGLGRPILGSETSIRRLRRLDLLNFFRRNYRPEQLIISVAGDVSHELVKKKLRALCRTAWPGRHPNARLDDIKGAPAIKTGTWWIKRPTEQVHLVWGVEGPRYTAKERYAAFLLNVYLGGGMSSALFQEIREKKGLAYTVYSSLSPFLDSGVFSIYAATPMHHTALCLKLIEECVGRLKKELLPPDELQAIKENLKGGVLLSSDSIESRMLSVAKNELFFGDHLTVEEVCNAIDQVSAADIRRVARKLLSSERRSVLALGPAPSRSIASRLRPKIIK